jgi:hypothetical protein
MSASVFTEGYGIDDCAYLFDTLWINILILQKAAGVGVVLGVEQLMIVNVMKQSRQRYDVQVALRVCFRDLLRISVHSERMTDIMSVRIALKHRFNIFFCLFNHVIHIITTAAGFCSDRHFSVY